MNQKSLNEATEGISTAKQQLREQLVTLVPYRNVRQLILVVSILCLGPYYYGFTLTYISTIELQTLSLYFGPQSIKGGMLGLLIGIVPIGAGVGALIAPLFMTLFTRKNFILFFNLIAIFASGLIQINQLPVLLLCRFMQGVIIGNYMGLTPLYIKEITPSNLRGGIGALSQFFIIAAIVICYSLGVILTVSDVNKQFFWRFMFSINTLTVLIQSLFLIFNFVPQSPISLIQKGALSQAKKVLALFNTQDVLEKVFNQYIKLSKKNKFKLSDNQKMKKQQGKKRQVQLGVAILHSMTFKINDDMNKQETYNKQKQTILLTNPSYGYQAKQLKLNQNNELKQIRIKSTSIIPTQEEQEKGWLMQIPKSILLIGFQIPLMQQFSGVKTIVAQLGIILSFFSQRLSLYIPLLTNIIQFIATGLSIIVLARYGRRPIILFGNLGVAMCSLIIGFFFLSIYITQDENLVYGAVVFIFLFMVIYGLTIGPAVWLYIPEIIPANLVPPATFTNWLGISISLMVTPIVIEEVGSPYPVFIFFGVVSLLFFVVNYIFVIQTKGLQMGQIASKQK